METDLSRQGENELENDTADVPDDMLGSEGEEDEIDGLLNAGTSRLEAREDIRDWCELWEQIKSDLQSTQRNHLKLTQINQLLILRNFATLCIKGYKHMAASKEIAQQWHEGLGAYSA